MKNDFHEIFCENMKDELEDIIEDNDLYEALIAAGLRHEARTMEDIANDEYRHAKLYRKMLSGIPMSEEMQSLWDKVHRIFEEHK